MKNYKCQKKLNKMSKKNKIMKIKIKRELEKRE